MEEKHPKIWTAITNDLKTAALMPQQRTEFISRALLQLLASIPALGTALIWPCRNSKMPWKVSYAGTQHNAIHHWLSARLDASLDSMIGVLQQDLSALSDMPNPLLIHLNPISSPGALWIIWPTPSSLPGAIGECIERVRRTLEALLEVEDKEEQYFSASSPVYDRELIQALAHGDVHAMSAFLSLTRIVGKADFTFWAKAYQDIVEIAGHMGAIHGDFGFALPLGRGVGGRVAAYGTMIERGDYLNSPYRDPSVTEIVDSEQIRSGMALPIRYTTERGAHVAAVLYATRRTVAPFSLAERLLVQRLARQIEPLPLETPILVFLPTRHRASLRTENRVVRHCAPCQPR